MVIALSFLPRILEYRRRTRKSERPQETHRDEQWGEKQRGEHVGHPHLLQVEQTQAKGACESAETSACEHGENVDHFETERLRKDGGLLNISLVISATKDTDGKIFGILKIARDITFRKKAEEIQTRMANIISLSDDAIYSKTLDGTISSWN